MPEKQATRIEHDSLGPIDVPADRLWGAQTQRSILNFPIGDERVPMPFIHAIGLIKQAAAQTNRDLGIMDSRLADAIMTAAEEVAGGRHDGEFPLVVWQTGSGTQTNMNANEVIANRASELLGGRRGLKEPVHPNDHVNLSQSSNDTFPTAIHVAAVLLADELLFPAIERLHESLAKKAKEFVGDIKIGRTHTQDATPVTLGQEFSGYAAMMVSNRASLKQMMQPLLLIAQGGTAVGTGINAPETFGEDFAKNLGNLTGHAFLPSPNRFEALTSHNAVLNFHGAMNTLAADLHKIANDIRLLASGPRSGLGEISLPANEPGSSIMPGKVNPTQAEALTMVCAQVMGNQQTITFAASQGQFELNVYKPVIALNFLQSIRLLADAMNSFAGRCVDGITANRERMADLLSRSLMLVTALAPAIGYDAAAGIAKKAHENSTTLREEAVKSGLVSEEEFDRIVRPDKMI